MINEGTKRISINHTKPNNKTFKYRRRTQFSNIEEQEKKNL